MKARNKFKVEVNQTIYDLVIQEYGTVESLFDMLNDNADKIPNLDTNLAPGTTLKAVTEAKDNDMLKYYKDRKLQPASFDNETVGMHGDFNDDFNNDFYNL